VRCRPPLGSPTTTKLKHPAIFRGLDDLQRKGRCRQSQGPFGALCERVEDQSQQLPGMAGSGPPECAELAERVNDPADLRGSSALCALQNAQRIEGSECWSWLAGGLQSGTLGKSGSPRRRLPALREGRTVCFYPARTGRVAKSQRVMSKRAEKGLGRDTAIGLGQRRSTFGAEKTPQKFVGSRAHGRSVG
jgi:hypothetical protein